MMFFLLLEKVIDGLLLFALHIESSQSFLRPLSPKEEREAFERLAKGDMNARNTLIEHNMRLVAHVVKKYYTGKYADEEDLISIGTIGLIKAVSSYSLDKNIKFATYAAKCIQNEVLMYFRSLKKTSLDVYMEDPIDTDKDGNTMTLMDIITFDDNIIEKVDNKIKARKLYDFVENTLNKREREIITMRYGLYGKKPLTQREAAKKLGISRSYVSRIEKKALENLRKKYDSTKLI